MLGSAAVCVYFIDLLCINNFDYAQLAQSEANVFFLTKKPPPHLRENNAYVSAVVLQEKTRGDSLGQVHLLVAVCE